MLSEQWKSAMRHLAVVHELQKRRQESLIVRLLDTNEASVTRASTSSEKFV
jgi:hypothetical protein